MDLHWGTSKLRRGLPRSLAGGYRGSTRSTTYHVTGWLSTLGWCSQPGGPPTDDRGTTLHHQGRLAVKASATADNAFLNIEVGEDTTLMVAKLNHVVRGRLPEL